MRLPWRKKRKPGEPLLKYLYYPDQKRWYSEFRAGQPFDACTDRLVEIYPRLSEVRDKYMDSLKSYVIFLGISLLFLMGVIDSIEFSGFSLSKSELAFPLAGVLALLVIQFTGIQVRHGALSAIFEQHYKAGTPKERVDLLMRFPEAFSFVKFRIGHETTSPPLYPHGGLLSLAALAIFMILGAILFFGVILFVFVKLGLLLWQAPGLEFWGKGLVIAIAGVLISSTLVPQGYFRGAFIHHGLVELFGRLQKRDPGRYSYFVSKLYDAHDRMFPKEALKRQSSSPPHQD